MLIEPHRVECLSDNGSCYIVAETIDFALGLGLMPRFTPVRSPESNGMSESFVKTFKRDYVRCNPRPDAETVLAQLDGWFEDYNDVHPHSGLKMLSLARIHSGEFFTRCVPGVTGATPFSTGSHQL